MVSTVHGINRYEIFKTVGGPAQKVSFGRVKANVDRYAKNVRRVPQVMFKAVKSGFASGFIGLSAQMSYVLGKAERIIDPRGEVDGERELDRARTNEIASRWADSWKKSTQDGRHSMHLVASFPAGTHTGAVECIVRDTCEELLSQGRNRFEYIASIHTDTDHPHGHIIVNRRNAEGEWFYLARDHEYNYDVFKDALVRHARTYGIELNNSSRLSRGLSAYPTDGQRAMRGIEGRVLDFGEAPYKHQEKGSDSFYITLQTKFGERTLWGVGLADVLDASEADRGDTIRIMHEGKREVVVKTKDGQTVTTHRNDWRIVFNGEEYGTFDDDKAVEPTTVAVAAAEKRATLVVAEADKYQRFANMVRGAGTALGIAFSAAAEKLRNGESVEALKMEDAVSEGMIENDSNELMQKIETAREQLDAVWQKLPEIAATERPHMEERYFAAVGDMDRLLAGERRREFELKAEGSVYTDEHRKRLAQQLPARSQQRLEQYGINRDEFMARSNVEAVSYVLESHWIERDAQAIAAHMNLDMETEAGREEAFQRAADLHNGLISDAGEQETLAHPTALAERADLDPQERERLLEDFNAAREVARKDTLTFEDSRTVIEGLEAALGKSGMRELQNGNLRVFEDAGLDVSRREAVAVTEKYIEAMRQHGYDMDKSEEALSVEKELLDLDDKIEELREEREQGDQARDEDRDEKDSHRL